MRPVSLHRAGVICFVIALTGCATETSLDSAHSSARIRGIQRAASDKDEASIPKLIKLLDSDDPAVRLLSIRTLEEMTHQTLGYDHAAPAYERQEAVRRWEQWQVERTSGRQPSGSSETQPPAGSSVKTTSQAPRMPDPEPNHVQTPASRWLMAGTDAALANPTGFPGRMLVQPSGVDA